jgi:hypothetical protein
MDRCWPGYLTVRLIDEKIDAPFRLHMSAEKLVILPVPLMEEADGDPPVHVPDDLNLSSPVTELALLLVSGGLNVTFAGAEQSIFPVATPAAPAVRAAIPSVVQEMSTRSDAITDLRQVVHFRDPFMEALDSLHPPAQRCRHTCSMLAPFVGRSLVGSEQKIRRDPVGTLEPGCKRTGGEGAPRPIEVRPGQCGLVGRPPTEGTTP